MILVTYIIVFKEAVIAFIKISTGIFILYKPWVKVELYLTKCYKHKICFLFKILKLCQILGAVGWRTVFYDI